MKFRRVLVALLTAIVTVASVVVVSPAAQAQYWGDDAIRESGVAQAVEALELYGLDHGSYTLIGTGYDGQGRGWFNKASGGGYATSISSQLVDGTYLSDGDWDNDAGSSVGDFAVYECDDRVAVFSQSDGIAPSANDSQWWTDNECNPYAINTLGLPYFQVSEPLEGTPSTCNGVAVTATTINAAGEIVGTSGDDVIVGTYGDDVIRGRGGNDLICGLAGDDWIRGDSGDDLIAPGPGVDLVQGGAGHDWAEATLSEELIDDFSGGSGDNELIVRFIRGTTSRTEQGICIPCVRVWRPW